MMRSFVAPLSEAAELAGILPLAPQSSPVVVRKSLYDKGLVAGVPWEPAAALGTTDGPGDDDDEDDDGGGGGGGGNIDPDDDEGYADDDEEDDDEDPLWASVAIPSIFDLLRRTNAWYDAGDAAICESLRVARRIQYSEGNRIIRF